MSAPPAEDLRVAFATALTEAAGRLPSIRLAEVPAASAPFAGFRDRFAERHGVVDDPADLAGLLERAAAGQHSAYLAGPAEALVPPVYPWVRAHAANGGGAFRLVAARSGLVGPTPGDAAPVLDDLTLLTTIPGMHVLVPSDAATVRAMVTWLSAASAPAYLRLTEAPCPPSPGPEWESGRARQLRDGTDLGLLAVGTMVPRALEVAEELARVGVAARVLDLASVKPIDLKAILRAARDTGALLTLEEGLVAHGVGATVASLTAENYPVPVRRLGIPDLAGPAGTGPAAMDALGLSRERIVEEAWELLRLKGKVQ